MKITISGKAGSGKTTLAKALATQLSFTFYSIGDLRGRMAIERGLTIDQLNEIGKKEDWTDLEADALTKKVGETENNIIVEGWVAYHFIPDSVKVFLTCDMDTGSERVFKDQDQRKDEAAKTSSQEIREILEKRMQESADRYQRLYNINYLDHKNFDLIIDTTQMGPDEVLQRVLNFLKV